MNLNVILRGQSNAEFFGTANGGANLTMLAQDVERLLGFDGKTDMVSVLFAANAENGANTVVGGTAFLTEWVSPQNGDWHNGWFTKSLEQDLLDYIGKLSADQRDDPTAVLWCHSEFDSQLSGLTTAEWESGVRYDASLVRAALGQSAATVPYLFVSAQPYKVSWGQDTGTGHQAIRQGMEELSADPVFNADIAARVLDTNINRDDPNLYGDQHLSASDQAIAEGRIMRSLAETWAAYAKPGSPLALASGQIDDHGPHAVAATALDANQLSVRFALDGATNLRSLDPDAAHGLGWSIRSAAGETPATAATLMGTNALLLTFGQAIPADGKLFYGWGYGRLADGNTPGQGHAVYDEQGMPVWADASGLAVTGTAAAATLGFGQLASTVGSGPDALVLSISQDAYRGSAQYAVKVDGVAVGGTLAASALHATGLHDTVTVLGTWAAGPHAVTVEFLNDAYGGSAAADRNLYVDGATYNGAAVAGAPQAIGTEWQPGGFSFLDPLA